MGSIAVVLGVVKKREAAASHDSLMKFIIRSNRDMR
jgi:hypothetical protein